MQALTIGEAAARTGWSARMLRYLESVGLVVPSRTTAGYRVYGDAELLQLRDLRLLREQFRLELDEVAFAARLRRGWTLERAVGTPVQRGDMESGLRAAEAELRRRI